MRTETLGSMNPFAKLPPVSLANAWLISLCTVFGFGFLGAFFGDEPREWARPLGFTIALSTTAYSRSAKLKIAVLAIFVGYLLNLLRTGDLTYFGVFLLLVSLVPLVRLMGSHFSGRHSQPIVDPAIQSWAVLPELADLRPGQRRLVVARAFRRVPRSTKRDAMRPLNSFFLLSFIVSMAAVFLYPSESLNHPVAYSLMLISPLYMALGYHRLIPSIRTTLLEIVLPEYRAQPWHQRQSPRPVA